MSKERALRRAAREREAAAVAATRAVEADREARKRQRHRRLFGWVPRPAPAPSGSIAARRRRDTSLFFCLVFAVNLLFFMASDGWALRALVLLLSLFLAPIVVLLISKK